MSKKPINFKDVMVRIVAAAVAVWMLIVGALTVLVHHTGTTDTRDPSDAIVVLGAGLSRSGRPGYALTRRSAHAASLWHDGLASTIVCTGGVAPHQRRSEADGCLEVLQRHGVPASAVLLEEQSTSTEENALYARDLLADHALSSVIIVSDSYHIYRARYIFEQAGFDTIRHSPVSADLIRGYPTYEYSLMREIIALHWQVFKTLLNIPITSI